MPNYANMFTNRAVLNQAIEKYNKRIALAKEATSRVPKPFKKVEEAEEENTKKKNKDFDTRHPTDIATLIIDTSHVPKEKQDEYFLEEAEKITRDFFTIDEETRRPNPDAIKSHIKKVYDKMTRDINTINWDSVDDVTNLIATMKASQGFATLVSDFPNVIFELYPTLDDVKWLDDFTAKATLICHDARIALDSNPETATVAASLGFGHQSYDTIENKILSETGHAVIDARINNSNVIHLDALATDTTKNFFLDTPFEVENDGVDYNNDSFSKDFILNLSTSYKHTSIEQMPDVIMKNASDDHFFEYDHLYINGKSIRDYMRELENKNMKGFQVQAEAGKLLKNALTDGKSIVTMLQMQTGSNGQTRFYHHEIQVDLDKLNEVDKRETNYSRFRRFLDRWNIYKIQKFKSNKQRDAAQAKLRNKPKFQDALKTAEEKFINLYNSDEAQNELAKSNPGLAEAIPKIVREEDYKVEKQNENSHERISINSEDIESQKTVSVSPKSKVAEKTTSIDSKKI